MKYEILSHILPTYTYILLQYTHALETTFILLSVILGHKYYCVIWQVWKDGSVTGSTILLVRSFIICFYKWFVLYFYIIYFNFNGNLFVLNYPRN